MPVRGPSSGEAGTWFPIVSSPLLGRDIVFGALALPLFHGALWGLLLLLSRRS